MTLRLDRNVGSNFRIERTAERSDLVVVGRWSDEAAAIIQSGDVDGLILNYALGFDEPNLDFIEEWPLKRLDLLDRSIKDLRPLDRIAPTLEELSIEAHPRAALDTELPSLRSLAGEWRLIRDAADRAVETLESLITWRFDGVTMLDFVNHQRLATLTVKDAPYLESLDGIEGLTSLSSLAVYPARELADLSALTRLRDSLRQLKLEGCKEVSDLEDISTLVQLRFLNIGNCWEIASLGPITALSSLTTLYAYESTRVMDGDLSPLLELPALSEVRMRDRKQYRPPLAEVVAAINNRR